MPDLIPFKPDDLRGSAKRAAMAVFSYDNAAKVMDWIKSLESKIPSVAGKMRVIEEGDFALLELRVPLSVYRENGKAAAIEAAIADQFCECWFCLNAAPGGVCENCGKPRRHQLGEIIYDSVKRTELDRLRAIEAAVEKLLSAPNPAEARQILLGLNLKSKSDEMANQ